MKVTGELIDVVVLISGSGSNLQALIDAQQNGSLAIRISAVISNRPGVKGLQRAEQAGIPAILIDHTHYSDRNSFDADLMQIIDQYHPDLVVLAGFMRIFTPDFANHYLGRMLNIHPSLLPKYQGLHTHRRALEAGDKEHGVTVHFVTAELDGGPPVLQAKVPIMPDDQPDTLAQRVLIQEHIIYPMAVSWYAEGRLAMKNGRSYLDGELLPVPGHLMNTTG